MITREGYELTPLGLVGQDVLDIILLYMTKIDKNAVIWNGKEFIFTKVGIVKRGKK